MYYVYVIKADKFDRIYTGLTSNLQNRIKEHNRGQTKSTKGYRPWKLVYSEEYGDRAEARKKEKQLKSGCCREFIKSIVNTYESPRSSDG